MNKYYCTACNKESVFRALTPTLTAVCCKGSTSPTAHRLVSLKNVPTNPTVKTVDTSKDVQPQAPAPAIKPQTVLDLPAGAKVPVVPTTPTK